MSIKAADRVVTKSQNLPPTDSRERVKQFVQNLQDNICAGLEQLDGKASFREDSWQREARWWRTFSRY